MKKLLQSGRRLKVVGVDDAPFDKHAPGSPVNIAGVVCTDTRLEGMLWGTARMDGTDATQVIGGLIGGSKFADQLHLVLLDGVTIGGLNVVDLPALSERLQLPCVTVMRRPPNLERMKTVVMRLADGQRRWQMIQRAGTIHTLGGFCFQVAGEEPELVARALKQLTDRGKVPECLRLAHLIGAAVMTGESSKRA